MSKDELDALREEMKMLTLEIFRLTGRRMRLSQRIGEIKKKLDIDVEVPEVESRLRAEVLEECRRLGLSEELATKILNLILGASVKMQKTEGSDSLTT